MPSDDLQADDAPPGLAAQAVPPRDLDAALQELFARTRSQQALNTAAVIANTLVQRGSARLAEHVAADAWRLVDEVAARSPARPLHECARGCNFCCHQQVSVTPAEAIALAGGLRETFPAPWLEQLRALLAQRSATIAGFTSMAEYFAAGLPCGFLGAEGECAVYAWRPVMCRGYHSLSRASCQEKYVDPAAPPPAIDRAGHRAAQATLQGVAAGVAAAGLDGRFYELHGALLRALDTPDAAARWAGGEDVFNGCRPSGK